jgi:hypothetical protein
MTYIPYILEMVDTQAWKPDNLFSWYHVIKADTALSRVLCKSVNIVSDSRTTHALRHVSLHFRRWNVFGAYRTLQSWNRSEEEEREPSRE